MNDSVWMVLAAVIVLAVSLVMTGCVEVYVIHDVDVNVLVVHPQA